MLFKIEDNAITNHAVESSLTDAYYRFGKMLMLERVIGDGPFSPDDATECLFTPTEVFSVLEIINKIVEHPVDSSNRLKVYEALGIRIEKIGDGQIRVDGKPPIRADVDYSRTGVPF